MSSSQTETILSPSQEEQFYGKVANFLRFLSVIWGIVAVWSLFGFIAFITSIVCFFKKTTALEGIAGLLLAVFLGPIYFLFFFFSPTYCAAS